MKLLFTPEEQNCITYLVQCLIKADGLVSPEENVCWNTIVIKLGWQESENITFSDGYDLDTALNELSKMDTDKKRFAIAFFKMIILADQQIAPEEMDLLGEIILKGNLMEVAITDCAHVLEEYLV